jgi:hypothetical protein
MTEAEQIMAEIVDEHGLIRLADLALARALAEALLDDPPNPSLIVALRNALVPRTEAAKTGDGPDLSRLDDEEFALLGSLRLRLDGKPDPRRHLYRLSALRQRCAILEAANAYLQDRLRAARRMPQDVRALPQGRQAAPEPYPGTARTSSR